MASWRPQIHAIVHTGQVVALGPASWYHILHLLLPILFEVFPFKVLAFFEVGLGVSRRLARVVLGGLA